ILATGIMILAFISLAIGIILDSICRSRREIKRMHYLANTTLSEEKK
ncbi:MAG: glycosyl transferase, partial [Pseudomonadota bacterium]|nr:glycosyl transferase [Pseudomonadota bacterium]